jgi:hypothetical protein
VRPSRNWKNYWPTGWPKWAPAKQSLPDNPQHIQHGRLSIAGRAAFWYYLRYKFRIGNLGSPGQG